MTDKEKLVEVYKQITEIIVALRLERNIGRKKLIVILEDLVTLVLLQGNNK